MTDERSRSRMWPPASLASSLAATVCLVVCGCGGTETSGRSGSDSDGGRSGDAGASGGVAAGNGGSGISTGGSMGSGGAGGSGGARASGGAQATGSGGVGPDAGPPAGPCGGNTCGPGTSCCGPPECGYCVPSTSGVFCSDSCDHCSGAYQRFDTAVICTGERTAMWEVTSGPLTPFVVPECQDAVTALPRFCCTDAFRPVCP